MPVILTEIETWMTATAEQALKLQRPLLDGVLEIVARGDLPLNFHPVTIRVSAVDTPSGAV
jgi:hypothetical protein